MKIKALGHVVLRVADRDRAEAFYNGVLGLPVAARLDQGGLKMAFFTLGNHHDLAVMETGGGEARAPRAGPGLHHVAFNIGTTMQELHEAKARLEAAGLKVAPVDHDVTKSLYFEDPDGNGVEVYVDVSDAWKTDPQRIAGAKPMAM